MYYWCNFFQPEKLLKVIQLLYKTPRKCRATAIDWSKNLCGNNIFCLRHLCFHSKWRAVWPDLPIYWTLGNFSKPLATISLPKTPTFLGNFLEVSKYLIFLVKSFLGNFYRHLATFHRSHCMLRPGQWFWALAMAIRPKHNIYSYFSRFHLFCIFWC